jgi:hypothetical protein
MVDEFKSDDERLGGFVRAELQRAIIAAELADRRSRLITEYTRFGKFRDSADRAAKAIGKFRRLLGAEKPVIVYRLLSLATPSGDHLTAMNNAEFAATELERAETLLENIKAAAEARRALWAKEQKNFGHPDKATFHKHMVEMWWRLFKGPPSRAKDVDTNRFLVACEAGWQDWKKRKVSFASVHAAYFRSMPKGGQTRLKK